MRIRHGTSSMFIQDKKQVIKYLQGRNVNSQRYYHFLRSRRFGLLDDARFSVGGIPYEITHFLSRSEIMGYDIASVNCNFNLEGTDDVAIALVSGDDVICYNTRTQEVYLWQIQNGDGEKIQIANSLDRFFEIIDN